MNRVHYFWPFKDSTEIGKKAGLFAKLQPGRARKGINATYPPPFSRALYKQRFVIFLVLRILSIFYPKLYGASLTQLGS